MGQGQPRDDVATLLALDMGLEGGWAIFDGEIPKKWGPYYLEGRPSKQMGEFYKLLTYLISVYAVEVVAMEPYMPNWRPLISEVYAVAKERGLRVITVDPGNVKEHVTGDRRATKSEVARFVRMHLVALGVEAASREKHHVYDALAIGLEAAQLLKVDGMEVKE